MCLIFLHTKKQASFDFNNPCITIINSRMLINTHPFAQLHMNPTLNHHKLSQAVLWSGYLFNTTPNIYYVNTVCILCIQLSKKWEMEKKVTMTSLKLSAIQFFYCIFDRFTVLRFIY